jgi:uncharacterized protein DUF5684
MKKVIGLFLLSLCFLGLVFAETIILKSGKQIEGEKIEQTDDYIKIDFYGIPVTYYFNDIQSIDGKPLIAPQSKPQQSLATEYQPTITESKSEATTPPNNAQEASSMQDNIQPDITPVATEASYSSEGPIPTRSHYNERSERLISNKTNQSMQTGGLAIAGLILILQLAIGILMLVSLWKVFVKAGQPGWAIFIPFYNQYVLLKIAEKPGWWLILLFIPIVNVIVGIILSIAIAEKFSKSMGYGIGLAFLPFIFFPMLAFGEAQYTG